MEISVTFEGYEYIINYFREFDLWVHLIWYMFAIIKGTSKCITAAKHFYVNDTIP